MRIPPVLIRCYMVRPLKMAAVLLSVHSCFNSPRFTYAVLPWTFAPCPSDQKSATCWLVRGNHPPCEGHYLRVCEGHPLQLLVSLVADALPWCQFPCNSQPPLPQVMKTSSVSCLLSTAHRGSIVAPGACISCVRPPSVKSLVSQSLSQALSSVLRLGNYKTGRPEGYRPTVIFIA